MLFHLSFLFFLLFFHFSLWICHIDIDPEFNLLVMAFFKGFSLVIIINVSIFFAWVIISFKEVVILGFCFRLLLLGFFILIRAAICPVLWLEGQVEELVAYLAHVYFELLLIVWWLLVWLRFLLFIWRCTTLVIWAVMLHLGQGFGFFSEVICYGNLFFSDLRGVLVISIINFYGYASSTHLFLLRYNNSFFIWFIERRWLGFIHIKIFVVRELSHDGFHYPTTVDNSLH